MSLIPSLSRKIYTADTIAEQVNNWHKSETIVFTNGCFDILHLGHVDYLNRSAQLGSKLVIGLNTDASVRKIKGENFLSKEGIYDNKKMRVYVSKEAHSSIDKAMDILGLGINNLIKIKTKKFKIDSQLLKEKINKDIKEGYKPIGVIGIAGTTNTGSVDPLKILAKKLYFLPKPSSI